MAYRIEAAQNPDEALYWEIALVNRYNGEPLTTDGVQHVFNLYGRREDYGIIGQYGQTLASTANGLITTPAKGVLAITIPPSVFSGYTVPDTGVWIGGFERHRSLRFRLLAGPGDLDSFKTLAVGTITLGDRTMDPRLTLQAYPMYPAPPVPTVDVTQVKTQLAAMGLYDTAEAGLPASPVDPARIAWDTGGSISLGGPLSNSIAASLSFDPVAMTIFLNAAAAQPT